MPAVAVGVENFVVDEAEVANGEGTALLAAVGEAKRMGGRPLDHVEHFHAVVVVEHTDGMAGADAETVAPLGDDLAVGAVVWHDVLLSDGGGDSEISTRATGANRGDFTFRPPARISYHVSIFEATAAKQEIKVTTVLEQNQHGWLKSSLFQGPGRVFGGN